MTQKGVIFDPYFGPPILSPCQVWSTRVRGFGHVPLKSGQKRGPKSDPFWVIFDPYRGPGTGPRGSNMTLFGVIFDPFLGPYFGGFQPPAALGVKKGSKIGVQK